MSDNIAPMGHIVRLAVSQASQSACRSQRGAVVFNRETGEWLGSGWNSRAMCDRSDACKATCSRAAVHAEQAALLQAKGSCDGHDLLHAKVIDSNLVVSGAPSCMECAKIAAFVGIDGVWLFHLTGWHRYPIGEFLELSEKNMVTKFKPGERGDLESIRYFTDMLMPHGIERDDSLMRLDALLK